MRNATWYFFTEFVFGCFGVRVGFVDMGEASMGCCLVSDPCEVVEMM